MSKVRLLCKTKGNASPQGKPRVYFCAHFDDYAPYFEKVCGQIFQTQNCAVYYKENPSSVFEDEELQTELSQVQLFVIPVTSKFLRQENAAREQEFRFAIENRIPVLPLMQETGMERLFNERCGELQTLNEYEEDDTALPFEDKLKNFLSAVLVGDELAKKVRDAFDGYIFLSYRKKDRKYAQELMKLIHENEFCRDIAIWYDEFLTLGENFNQSILDALKKSELFALVVTPNLVNEENYVMNTEYPLAKESGKKILPAEFVKTDGELLQEKYSGLGEVMDARNREALSNALALALSNVFSLQNRGDALHDFLIGIAYLSGIDVEVNKKRGVALIEKSAGQGLPEAMKKLSVMYQTGESVNRNYQKSIVWQKRLVGYYRNLLQQSERVDDDLEETYIQETERLAQYYFENRNIKKMKSTYRALIGYLSKALKRNPENVYVRNVLIYAYGWFGVACGKEGDFAGEEQAYQEALKFADGKDYGGLSMRAIAYDRMATLLVRRDGDIEKAREYYLAALKIRERLQASGNSLSLRRNIALSYVALGDLSLQVYQIAEGEAYFQKSLEAFLNLSEETGAERDCRQVSTAYNRLSSVAMERGDFKTAKEFAEKALEITERLFQEFGSFCAMEDWLASYARLADCEIGMGEWDAARQAYSTALDLAQNISQETFGYSANKMLCHCYERSADLYFKMGKYHNAKGEAEYAIELGERLLKEQASVDLAKIVVEARRKLAMVFTEEKAYAEAKEIFEKAFAEAKSIAEKTGEARDWRDVYIFYNEFARIYTAEGEFSKAEDAYMVGLRLQTELLEKYDTVQALRDVSVVYNGLGILCFKQKLYEKARGYFTQGLSYVEKILDRTDAAKYRADKSGYAYWLGRCCALLGDMENSKKWFVETAELDEKLLAETGEERYRVSLLNCYNRLATIYQKSNEIGLAFRYYNRLIPICDNLLRKSNERAIRMRLAAACEYVALVLETLKRVDEARVYRLRLASVCESLAKEFDNPKDWEALAINLYNLSKYGDDGWEEYRARAYKIYCDLAERYPENARYASVCKQWKDSLHTRCLVERPKRPQTPQTPQNS